MSKPIFSTSLAKRKSDAKDLRRSAIAHGNTDGDAIEEKRQHSAKQLIKLGEIVSRLNKHRILLESQGEKKIAELREQFSAKRADMVAKGATEEVLKRYDAATESSIENESFGIAALIADHELRTSSLSAQMMTIDALNLVVDCLSVRDVTSEDGKKSLVRDSTAAYLSDILSAADAILEQFSDLNENMKRIAEMTEEDRAPSTQSFSLPKGAKA